MEIFDLDGHYLGTIPLVGKAFNLFFIDEFYASIVLSMSFFHTKIKFDDLVISQNSQTLTPQIIENTDSQN